jgi:hypothetical protein
MNAKAAKRIRRFIMSTKGRDYAYYREYKEQWNKTPKCNRGALGIYLVAATAWNNKHA